MAANERTYQAHQRTRPHHRIDPGQRIGDRNGTSQQSAPLVVLYRDATHTANCPYDPTPRRNASDGSLFPVSYLITSFDRR